MTVNPSLLELNTRVWIKQFGQKAGLSDISEEFLDDVTSKGIEILWLMGIWKTSKSLTEKNCFGIDLVPSYVKALSDWKKEDVIGSPFAIDDYVVNPDLGDEKDLMEFKKRLNARNIKLFLDFIPNHFGADSPLLDSDPEIFLQTDRDSFIKDPYAFIRHGAEYPIYIAHGRDPFFPPWSDTVQLNYFELRTRELMIEKLLYIATVADGVRCDMAMLPLNNVFNNTWLGVLSKSGYKKPITEFWKTAIERTREKNPDFLFMAESYWDLEWQLQQLGFDYTYDKTLTDRLSGGDVAGIKAHLHADLEFQQKSVRFIENHDEERAITKFGRYKSLAAAVVISSLPGVRLYYEGQFEGRKTRLPVQLGREPAEKVSLPVEKYYKNLLRITSTEIFKKGTWKLLNPEPAGSSNDSWENFLSWCWSLNDELRIVIINYSHSISQCRIKIDLSADRKEIELVDLMTDIVYKRRVSEITETGLFIELKGYHSHIFAVKL